jgi:hypothetical protein
MAKIMEASPPLFPLLLLLTLLACHHHRVARGYKFCGVDVDDAADAVRGYALVCRNDDDDDDDDDDDEEGGWGGRRTMTGPTHGCFYIYMLSIICAFRWDGGYISNGRLIVSSFTLFHSPRLVTFHHPLAALPPHVCIPIHPSIHPSIIFSKVLAALHHRRRLLFVVSGMPRRARLVVEFQRELRFIPFRPERSRAQLLRHRLVRCVVRMRHALSRWDRRRVRSRQYR